MVALRFMVWSVFTLAGILILGTVSARAADRPTVALADLQNLKVGKFSLAVSAAEKREICSSFLVDSASGRQEWPFVGQASADRQNTDCSMDLAKRGLLAGNPSVKWDSFKPRFSGLLRESALARVDSDQLACVKQQRDEMRAALRDARTLSVLSQEFELAQIDLKVEQLTTGPEGETQVKAESGRASVSRGVDGKRRLQLVALIRDGKCFTAADTLISDAVAAEFRPIQEARDKAANEKAARDAEARRRAQEHDAQVNRAGKDKDKIDDMMKDLNDPRVESDLEIKVSDWWKRVRGNSGERAPAEAGSAQ